MNERQLTLKGLPPSLPLILRWILVAWGGILLLFSMTKHSLQRTASWHPPPTSPHNDWMSTQGICPRPQASATLGLPPLSPRSRNSPATETLPDLVALWPLEGLSKWLSRSYHQQSLHPLRPCHISSSRNPSPCPHRSEHRACHPAAWCLTVNGTGSCWFSTLFHFLCF